MLGFVDDSAGQVNLFLEPNQDIIPQLAEMMQSDAELWSALLEVTGGALELPKCSYHITHYSFCGIGTPVLQGHKEDISIKVTALGTTKTIKQLSPYTTYWTLGVFKSPSGGQEPPKTDSGSGDHS